jgi:hypothetical protein
MSKGFWNTLCKEFNYRFFAGIPFEEVAELYANMDSEIMHYVPASNEHIALNLAIGSRVSGFKSGVILNTQMINKLDLSFNFENDVPILFISTSSKEHTLRKDVYSSNDLTKVLSYMDKRNSSGIVLLS